MIRVLTLVVAVASPALPQPFTALPIEGDLVRRGAALDAAALARLPPAEVTATDHDGTPHRYSGVRLSDALRDAGSPLGEAVRGPAARAYVVVTAADGYAATFSLAELDTTEARCAPLLADRQDGNALSADVGPLRVVAACDRTHARWVRGVTKLTVMLAAGNPA